MASLLQLRCEYDPRVNFALQQNDVPMVGLLQVDNLAETRVEDVTIRVSSDPGVFEPWTTRIASIDPAATHNLRTLPLRLSADRLAAQTEAESGHIRVEATIAGQPAASLALDFEILAYNQWSGLRSLPELLAAFVLPNQPAVSTILGHARLHLEAHVGDPSFDGYQRRSRKRVLAMAASIYAALQDLGVTYVNPPASFGQEGQKVRLPDQVVAEQMGTCLDLTVTLAACLEHAGLHSFLCVIEGHAFPGVWLDEFSLPEPAVFDAAAIRKRVDGEEAIVFESSAVAQGVDFLRAVALGRRHLDDDDGFLCAIDIARARRAKVRPLPVRRSEFGWQAAPEPPPAPRSDSEVRSAALPELQLPRAEEDMVAESTCSRLDRWKSRLLDLSLRNRLLHTRFTLKSVIPLLAADIARLEDVLADGARLALLPRPDDREVFGERSAELVGQRVQADAREAHLAAALDQKRVHTLLSQAELGKRLTTLHRSSRTTLEESGSNTLYLAVGFLSWFEADTSETERAAPLILLPVQLVRGSAREPFRLVASDDDPRINVTLIKKLEHDFGLDVAGLDALPVDDSGLDVPLILNRFRRAVMEMPRWDVRALAAVAEFSFAKHLMWLDLEDRTQTLLANPVFEHIMEGKGAPYELARPFVAPQRIDAERAVQDDLCVVDADSSQLAAVFAAKDGNSFVLQGPPGTGKSQTITNLIAQLVGDGKTVLFVSEKMAALDVVHSRLQRVGMAEFCLELHSNKSSKGEVLKQLGQALNLAGSRSAADWARRAGELHDLRGGLNGFATALHRPGPYGDSVFRATSIALKYEDEHVQRLEARPEAMSRAHVDELRQRIDAVAIASRDVGDPSTHAWRGVPVGDWTPRAEQEIAGALDAVLEAAEGLDDSASAAAKALGMVLPDRTDTTMERLDRAAELMAASPSPPSSMLRTSEWPDLHDRIAVVRDAVRHRRAAWAQVAPRFDESLLTMDLAALHARFRRWSLAFFLLAFFMLWSARRALKRVAKNGKLPPNDTICEDLESAITVQRADRTISTAAGTATRHLGALWRGLDTDWAKVTSAVEWVDSYRSLALRLVDEMEGGAMVAGPDGLDRLARLATEQRELLAPDRPRGRALRGFRDAWGRYRERRRALFGVLRLGESNPWRRELGDLETAPRVLGGWRAAVHDLRDWCTWADAVRTARKHDALRGILRAHVEGRLPGERMRPTFERALATWCIEEALESEPSLREFRGTAHDQRIERFRKLDTEIQAIAREEIRSRLAARVPALNGPGEMAILRKELKKQRRHMPIRKLISRISHTLTKLKPCVLMSPLSVAQYLDPELALFDVVVFDEASQIPPWDAVGAIARGKQVVVVGDSKQLPPTSFFQRSEEEIPDDDDMEELESILDECVRAGFVSHPLKWHYRSRHEALIAFSNHHYYDNHLHTFPAADHEVPTLGVKWRHVADGYYDKGRSRTNGAEANAVVREIERRLTDPALAGKSLGVVTFSQAQQSLILDLLDELRQRRPEVEPYFTEAVVEPVFVKNLENVQGDERDVMLFSICYGPDRTGKVSMNFGPLNRQGGERRLNVAITRARELLLVFSTLTPDQIDLARTGATGVHHLKTFLDYAKRGPRAIDEAIALDPTADFESPFEEAVCARMRQEGLLVDLQVGCAGYRIDLAVRDPERPGSYLLGVECDGATYHSARSARDRDRIRQSVLESLGWRLFRIWSLDWWHDSERVMARLVDALEEAQRARREGSTATAGSNGQLRAAAAPTPAQPEVDLDALLSAGASRLELPDQASPYQRAATPLLGYSEQWDDPRMSVQIGRRLAEVVSAEGPVHVTEATRRVAASWEETRATRGRIATVLDAMRHVTATHRPVRHGEFLWPVEIDTATWRSFRTHPDRDERRAAEHLPPEEVANAAEWLVGQAGAIAADELVIELSRLFGYQSTGRKVRAAMEGGIGHLVAVGRAQLVAGRVRLEA